MLTLGVRVLRTALLAFFAVGCAGGSVDRGTNIEDGDEVLIDPTLDSDNDGFTDLEELAANTDPFNADDRPYLGGWPIDACRANVVSTGNQVGDVTANFALTDQFGDTLRLHDFCGKAVMLVAAAMWCGNCRVEAATYRQRYQDYADSGFLVITLLAENRSGQTPSIAQLNEWADAYGIDHPVVADPGFGVAIRFIDGNTIVLPSTSLLGPGATVIKRDRVISVADIEAALPQ